MNDEKPRIEIDYRVPLPWVITMALGLMANVVVGVWFGSGVVHKQVEQSQDIGELKSAVLKLIDVQVQMAVLTARVVTLESNQTTRLNDKEARR